MNELITCVNRLDRVKTHTVSLIRGTVADDNLKDVDIGKYHETVRILAQNLRNRTARTYRFKGARLKAAQDILQRRLIHETLVQQRQLIPCYAGKLNLVLTESGDVYPCESFTGKLGNVRECNYDMTRILTTREARNIINAIQGDGCYCTHECYLMTNILFNPHMIPALLREYIKL
jgi:radical SAM protein with 4Fe4S-binding SPASM domain